MNVNQMLDRLLGDYVPSRYRRLVHAAILIAGLAVTIWQSVDGDWRKAVVAFAVALYGAANKANTSTTDVVPAGFQPPEDDVPDNGEAYEQAGGQPFPESDESDPQAE